MVPPIPSSTRARIRNPRQACAKANASCLRRIALTAGILWRSAHPPSRAPTEPAQPPRWQGERDGGTSESSHSYLSVGRSPPASGVPDLFSLVQSAHCGAALVHLTRSSTRKSSLAHDGVPHTSTDPFDPKWLLLSSLNDS